MPSGQEIKAGDLILVTGGTGFIGGYVIEDLCAKGYRVRVAVRDIGKKDNHEWLNSLQKKEGQIEYVEANYEKAVKGVAGVIHLASPYLYSAVDPQKEIVDPAIEGVVSMLNACAKESSTIKRVVLTSSGGAVFHFPVKPGYVFTKDDWNTSSSLANHPYFLSKKLAEENGWSVWKEHKNLYDFVVVNPLLVFGPLKNTRANASQSMISKYLTGESTTFQPGGVGVCDVRDVSEAHVIALEHPKAVGQRLFVWSQSISWLGIVSEMKKQYPEYPVTPVTGEVPIADWSMDVQPLKDLGKKSFRQFEATLHDTVEAWIELGVVPNLRKK